MIRIKHLYGKILSRTYFVACKRFAYICSNIQELNTLMCETDCKSEPRLVSDTNTNFWRKNPRGKNSLEEKTNIVITGNMQSLNTICRRYFHI